MVKTSSTQVKQLTQLICLYVQIKSKNTSSIQVIVKTQVVGMVSMDL